MTTAIFKHLDPSSELLWSKVDGGGVGFLQREFERPVHNLRGRESEFDTENAGFAVYNYPAREKSFTDDAAIREGYYQEVEQLVRDKLPGVKKVVIFDHTIRRRVKGSARQPVQQVHVDQTPHAAEVRVRRHVPEEEAEELLKGRYQIINVWRPIENPASDHPLAVIDWRSTSPEDFAKLDLLYPVDADNGKERPPVQVSNTSTEGYEAKGETLGVLPSDKHQFYYMKDMTPDEVMFLKCFDSRGEGMEHGKKGRAVRTPHTAFSDPQTPKDAPGRQSIEVRCLVFYE
ncbi:hypothetical protein M011DRAFT_484634 [Sporormia fimetaria CBS 119925]|uniref:Methyltransferase n=1 Tax=Sporormia fimetaria CBS 119925 TaxID=1340428 RepID=A0A6A6VJH8_9PLEO|nr:hypothetical protein M011DRAFT_484634 [Sporormia fimetaria CBS 119925]